MNIDSKKVRETALQLEKTMNEAEILQLCAFLTLGLSSDMRASENMKAFLSLKASTNAEIFDNMNNSKENKSITEESV